MFDLPLSPLSFSSRPQLRIMSFSFQNCSGSINIRLTCLTVLVIAVLSAALVPPAQAAINDNEAVMANRSIFKSTPNPTRGDHTTFLISPNETCTSKWPLMWFGSTGEPFALSRSNVNVYSLVCGCTCVSEFENVKHWHFDPLPSFLVFFLNHVQQTDAKIVNQGSGSAEQLPNGPRSSILDNIFNVSLLLPARFPESLFRGAAHYQGWTLFVVKLLFFSNSCKTWKKM